jgi:hypothetical protein
MAPYSLSEQVASGFGTQITRFPVDRKYIFMTKDDPNFQTKFGEEEYLVLESAINQQYTRVAQTTGSGKYVWVDPANKLQASMFISGDD